MQTGEELSDLLTVAEAAAYLKVPKSWIYERTRSHQIPVRKLGRHCRIPMIQFLAWIESQAKIPT